MDYRAETVARTQLSSSFEIEIFRTKTFRKARLCDEFSFNCFHFPFFILFLRILVTRLKLSVIFGLSLSICLSVFLSLYISISFSLLFGRESLSATLCKTEDSRRRTSPWTRYGFVFVTCLFASHWRGNLMEHCSDWLHFSSSFPPSVVCERNVRFVSWC